MKKLVSLMALCATVSFPGAAMAQNAVMINGTEIPADQVLLYQQHCMAVMQRDQATDTSTQQDTSTANANNDNSTDSNTTGDPAQLGAAAVNLVVPLDSVDLAACQESGIMEGVDMNAMAPMDNAMAPAGDAMAAAPDLASLTPAQRTALEDQCRTGATSMDAQTELNTTADNSNNDNSTDSSSTQNTDETGMNMTATPELCAQLGIPQ